MMDKKIFIDVSQVKKILRGIFDRSTEKWLQEEGAWPLSINLNIPKERTALNNLSGLQDWVKGWQQWRGAGALQWARRHWSTIGQQELPQKLLLGGPEEVAIWLGEQDQWASAFSRFQELLQEFPSLKGAMSKQYSLLATYSNGEWSKLCRVLSWFQANSRSQLYLRQLPIPEIDTKWIESRKFFLTPLLKILLNQQEENDFYGIAGLRREPSLIRIRLLDPKLREIFNHLEYMGISRFELFKLDLPIENVFIVENIRTGLAFHDLRASLVIMGLGYDVDVLANIPWLQKARSFYWGDIDTHGFAILNRLRHHLSEVKSILMDETILLAHEKFWSQEEKPVLAENLSRLSDEELALFSALQENRWGRGVRLEQERVEWPTAWQILSALVLSA